MGRKRRLMSPGLAARLEAGMRAKRRETLYRMLGRRNGGVVPCFVCGRHVEARVATLEHIVPLSKGGTDEMENLSISHHRCNQARGAAAGSASV